MKYIFDEISCDDLALASRALRLLLSKPDSKDAIVDVPDIMGELRFYVKRNKASVTVRQLPRT